VTLVLGIQRLIGFVIAFGSGRVGLDQNLGDVFAFTVERAS